MNTINWGIIGCGDVTEVKSGPAFNKVQHSTLVAVMRRNAAKAKDYASRHQVAKWYSNAQELIDDPEVNAIYVATPPDTHEEYTIASIKAGKPVYVEKPIARNAAACKRMIEYGNEKQIKISVAHYRRAQPLFRKLKEMIEEGKLGQVKFVEIKLLQPVLTSSQLEDPGKRWRINPTVSGGGLFHDLSPHQLDLMIYLFGKIKAKKGFAENQGKNYQADDIVSGMVHFENGVFLNGLWCFSVNEQDAYERCTITGSEGNVSFSIFGEPVIKWVRGKKTEIITFDPLRHVQQPMIEQVVQYFLGQASNPCSGEDALEVMRIIDAFTGHE